MAKNPARILTALLLPVCATCLADGDRGNVLPSAAARATLEEYPRPTNLPADDELEAQQMRIGEIRINPLNIFDTADPKDDTRLFRLANHLHIMTRRETIETQLLFRSGELYSGRLLKESERILRDTRYLRDAWIRPIACHDGVVDIEVITRDVWTLNPGISLGMKGGKTSSGIEIEDLNFLGRGQRLSVAQKSNPDRDSTLLRFQDRQLGRTWWSLDTQYSDNSDGETKQIALEHPFYSLDTRWAGGVSFQDDLRTDSLYSLGEVADEFQTRERKNTAYFGWSAGENGGWVRRWTAGFTVDQTRFAPIPNSSISTLIPADRNLRYPWLGFELVQDDFRTARNRDQIEKIEDISLGWHADLKLGFAAPTFGSDRSAWLFRATLAKGLEFDRRRTLMLESAATGRLESGSFADTLASLSARYYQRQSERRLLFLALSADLGTNLDLDNPLTLGGDNGLRGYPLRYQSGERRWLFTAEQRIFTNWYPFRLTNVGGAIFFDAGQVSGRDPLETASRGVLSNVGIGLRLGNSRSALGNVLHIDLAFPLNADPAIKGMQVVIETKRSF